MRIPRGNFSAALTSKELLAVISIIAVVIVLAVPAVKEALNKREMTRAMNNARELYLAGFHMATEGAARSDAGRAWPGDYPGGVTSLAEYCSKLVQNDYLKIAELQRILSAPGATCTVTSAGGLPLTVTLAGKSALKIYKAKAFDPSNTIFAASSNYVYDTPLSPAAIPFGDAGFIVVHKSGDAGVYRPTQATTAGYDNKAARFQSELGALPGAEKGSVVPGDGSAALTGPQ